MKIRRKATKKELEEIGYRCPKCGKIKSKDIIVETIIEDNEEIKNIRKD